MTATTINGYQPANGLGNCYEQSPDVATTTPAAGVIVRTRQARSPRARYLVLADITQAEAVDLAALVPNGTTVYLTGDFVPPNAAVGTSRGFTADIDGVSGRGVGKLSYEAFFDNGNTSGEIWTEAFA